MNLSQLSKKLLNLNYLLSIFICILIVQIPQISYSDEKDINKSEYLSFQLKELQNNNQWQEFVKNKEFSDINYDLYRITGPGMHDKVLLGEDPKGYIVNKHNEMFCFNQADKTCKVHSNSYVYGDMRASALLNNNFYKNREEMELASEVMRNIINPFPSNIQMEMQDASVHNKELPENKAALAEAYVSQARLSVVRNSFNTMFQSRLPLDLLEGKEHITKKKFSRLSIMEKSAKKRFEDIKWQEYIDTASQEDLLKELVKIDALKVWMDYHKYKQNERIEALLATMVAQQVSINQLLIDQNAKNH